MPSTARCAAAPTAAAARSGPGASGCTPSPTGSTPTPTSLLARAAYAEMALAGITSVGEFHYLHHGPGGVPYDDPNAMAEALRQAAIDAGVRLTLLDACYLTAGHRRPRTRRRPSGGSATARRRRGPSGSMRCAPRTAMAVGAAIHSVRAVPADGFAVVAARPGPAARPPVRAAGRERGVPRGLRPHPDRAARRCRRVGPPAPPRCTRRI